MCSGLVCDVNPKMVSAENTERGCLDNAINLIFSWPNLTQVGRFKYIKMKETYNRKKEMNGYEIGENISIHGHINDPKSWFITCRPLQIFGKRLCKKSLNKQEIARCVYQMLHNKRAVIHEIMNQVHPYT